MRRRFEKERICAPWIFQFDLRIERRFPVTERVNLEVIADGFNMMNHRNISDVNPLCDPTSGVCTAGQPTASFDPRTFPICAEGESLAAATPALA
jgi:hypothetical protein